LRREDTYELVSKYVLSPPDCFKVEAIPFRQCRESQEVDKEDSPVFRLQLRHLLLLSTTLKRPAKLVRRLTQVADNLVELAAVFAPAVRHYLIQQKTFEPFNLSASAMLSSLALRYPSIDAMDQMSLMIVHSLRHEREVVAQARMQISSSVP
jgi:hypothetical protein